MANQPEKLFKYCSISTAVQILESRKLRWSSPSVFNDPLELNHLTEANFDRDALLQATIKLASSMIFSSSNPRGDTPLINAIKRWREEERFEDPEEAETVLGELLAKMVDQRMLLVKQFVETWQQYNKQTRICCFTSRPDSVVAWDLFAQSHSGVCFRFDASGDASAADASPIEYRNQRPELVDLRMQIDAILYNQPMDDHFDFSQFLRIKPPSRKLEMEWRCFRKSPNVDIGSDFKQWTDDIEFQAEELSAVCFGIDIKDKDKEHIQRLLKGQYTNARSYQANLAAGKYDLEIQKL